MIPNSVGREQCKIALGKTHDKSFNEVFQMVSAFLIKYPRLNSYGGTIYGNIGYFNPNEFPVLKFHYCCDGINSSNIFVAFENDDCETDTVVLRDCKISSDVDFKIYNSFDPRPFDLQFRDLTIRPILDSNSNYLQKKLNSKLVKATRILFAENNNNNNNFSSELGAQIDNGYTGYFNFANSIGDIFRLNTTTDVNTNCAGIRYFFGYQPLRDDGTEQENKIRVILVGVNAAGKNLNTEWRETSAPFSLL